jgi:hypothetical protein
MSGNGKKHLRWKGYFLSGLSLKFEMSERVRRKIGETSTQNFVAAERPFALPEMYNKANYSIPFTKWKQSTAAR